MASTLSMMIITSALAFVSPTNLQSGQFASYYPGHVLNYGQVPLVLSSAEMSQQYPINDEIERTKGLGLSDLILFAQLTTRINQLENMVKDLSQTLTTPTSIGGMPTSCKDQRDLGNIKSGFYNVKNDTKIGTIFCDFTKSSTDSGFEKRIGYADVKTAPVHYFFGKGSYLTTSGEAIIFSSPEMNVGNAMDATTGVFTAPVNGTYFFAFTGTVDFGTGSTNRKDMAVELRRNNGPVAKAEIADVATITYQYAPIHLETTILLEKGDEIVVTPFFSADVTLEGSTYTSFTGILLEENLFPAA